jgi:hypothetical protein
MYNGRYGEILKVRYLWQLIFIHVFISVLDKNSQHFELFCGDSPLRSALFGIFFLLYIKAFGGPILIIVIYN